MENNVFLHLNRKMQEEEKTLIIEEKTINIVPVWKWMVLVEN